jgi:prepilin-type N-terminal cleavage/methylation domain-containing protein
MKTNRYKHGFTLIELLLALIITGIVASAVATLAYAMNSAGVATDDTSRKQAQVRFATLRISDLIRDCKLICYASASEMAIWTADTNPADGKINIGELTYIESGSSHNHLRLYTFTPPSSATISLDTIGALSTNWWTAYASSAPYTQLIPTCSNVTFNLDDTIKPPNSKIVSIAFNIVENQMSSKYQINAALHARAANLYDATSNSIVSDDD